MNGFRAGGPCLALALAFGLAGCAPGEDAEMADEATEDEAEVSLELPDTVGADVWGYLQAVDYPEAWALWPGRGARYPGGEPHGAMLTTYVNDIARGAIESRAGSIPAGGIVVKENFMPDSSLAAVTVMYKVDGYNPDNNDWWFGKYLPDGTLDRSPDGTPLEGRVGGCTGCHGGAAGNDFIFTAPLGGEGQAAGN